MPVHGTIASQFNDPGMNSLYKALMEVLVAKTGAALESQWKSESEMSEKIFIIPPARNRYLSEISETVRGYNKLATDQSEIADQLYALKRTKEII